MTKTQRKRYYETSPGVFSPMHTAEQADAHKLARAEGDGQVSNETARAYLNAFPADKTAEGIHALAIVRGLRERNRELEKLARIGELAIAAQKSTDYYCNESTIQPSEEDWRIDGTEEHKLWNAMEADIAALRAAIDAHLSSANTAPAKPSK
jgi:hypothetical protein